MTATIKEIPLLFQTEMVQAILDGRKTQTRRTKGLESKNEHPDNWNREGNPVRTLSRLWDSTKEKNPNPLDTLYGFKYPGWQEGCDIVYQSCPYGKPGDLLWVRETHRYCQPYGPESLRYEFKDGTYSDIDIEDHFKINDYDRWKPSIHMPKAACRIWLMVEEIRVEKLQDISEEDAIAEGVEIVKVKGSDGTFYKHYNVTGDLKKIADANNADPLTIHPISSFQSLWQSINGWESWNQNPWVWVVKFRVLSTTGRPSEEAIQTAYESITSK